MHPALDNNLKESVEGKGDTKAIDVELIPNPAANMIYINFSRLQNQQKGFWLFKFTGRYIKKISCNYIRPITSSKYFFIKHRRVYNNLVWGETLILRRNLLRLSKLNWLLKLYCKRWVIIMIRVTFQLSLIIILYYYLLQKICLLTLHICPVEKKNIVENFLFYNNDRK